MILSLNNQESAALTLHMSIMRKSFRNLLKKAYKEKKTEYLKAFDYVHEESKKGLNSTGNLGFDFYTMNLNIIDLEVLTEFLRAYTNKVNDEMGEHLQEEDKEQLNVLMKLWKKCNKIIEASA